MSAEKKRGILIDAQRLPLRPETVFIVFDLEWNQCPYGRDRSRPGLPFEIIDIGAVKLAQDLSILDTFHCFVRPQVYKSLHYRTREVIGIDRFELDGGLWFEDAAREFFSWCGNDFLFCTWGDTDLPELQRNLTFYDMLSFLPGPLLFADVQKMFAIAFEERRKRRSLEYAVDFLQLSKTREYHRAFDDAYYTAQVMQHIPQEIILKDFSVDTWQHPSSASEELRLRCSDYEKYISREFPSKEKALQDEEVRSLHCPLCGKNAKRVLKWTGKNGRYISLGTCAVHGNVYGRIRVKRTAGSKVYIEKVTRPVSEEEAAELLES